jgi:hypothetical protein
VAKVNPKALGSGRPKVEQGDFEGDFTIATIVKVEDGEIEDESRPGGKRPTKLLQFQEFGDKVIYLNVSQAQAMVDQLGDDDEAWVGQQIPVEKYTGTFGTKKFAKVGVMAAEEWDEAFKDAGVKRKKAAPAGAGVAAARGGRR